MTNEEIRHELEVTQGWLNYTLVGMVGAIALAIWSLFLAGEDRGIMAVLACMWIIGCAVSVYQCGHQLRRLGRLLKN